MGADRLAIALLSGGSIGAPPSVVYGVDETHAIRS
jgi:hypothetical protein